MFVTGSIGIDPDLAWDENGTCHATWASINPSGIVSAPIDPATGQLLAEPRSLWQGTGMAHPEAPHLYRIDGWWYLLLAEGGTERGHCATIARARTLDGPFEPAPTNPILTHRSTAQAVQNTGHADLVQLADGTWAAVLLASRPRGRTPEAGFTVNGRETFLVSVSWVDGWPVIDEDRFTVPPLDHSFSDAFATPILDGRWVGAGSFPASFTRHTDDGLLIDAEHPGPGKALLATRPRDEAWTASARFSATDGIGRLMVRIDDKHWYGLVYDGRRVEAVVHIGPAERVVGSIDVPAAVPPTLRVRALPAVPGYFGAEEPDLVDLAALTSSGEEHHFGSFDGRYLSSEVAAGFIGRLVGVEALSGRVQLLSFDYTAEG